MRRLQSRVPTQTQVIHILLMDIRTRVGLCFTLAQHFAGQFGGHIQIYDDIGLRKFHMPVFKVVQPAEELLAALLRLL